MALELISRLDFMCKLMCGAGPVDLRGSRWPRGRPDPENDRFSANLQDKHDRARKAGKTSDL